MLMGNGNYHQMIALNCEKNLIRESPDESFTNFFLSQGKGVRQFNDP